MFCFSGITGLINVNVCIDESTEFSLGLELSIWMRCELSLRRFTISVCNVFQVQRQSLKTVSTSISF
jgi:hypothetical protein